MNILLSLRCGGSQHDAMPTRKSLGAAMLLLACLADLAPCRRLVILGLEFLDNPKTRFIPYGVNFFHLK